MPQLLHDSNLVLQGLFEIAVGANELLLHPLDGNLAPFVTGRLVDLPEGALS